ncbi:RDD family protein [Streptomyces millisiae]|uniref:RDD family protein n=1 Tax=Streptomyces millisiae TaxID=3075542 RepID=A0ABU2LQK4_9ACTN|nr:RDD family protein [Streptomyces sp. DSM 44918]MDT0319868.1 RDD family protein [Streptomyces sp. DSM 44918]
MDESLPAGRPPGPGAPPPVVTDRDHLPPWISPRAEPGRETLADWGERVGAYLLDALLVLALLVGGGLALSRVAPAVIGVWIITVLLCYSPLCTAWWGGSPGKLAQGMRVARSGDGRPLTYGRALCRHVAHLVLHFTPLLGQIDYLWPLWDEPFQQCLHDKVVGSVVVVRG